MRAPAISWGVLLQEAQTLQAVAEAAWLLLPGVFVLIAVMALNFMGDGLRDARTHTRYATTNNIKSFPLDGGRLGWG